MPNYPSQIRARTGEGGEPPTRYRTLEDVEVIGIHRPVSWPKGTELVFMGFDFHNPRIVLVKDDAERTAKIPVRLLERLTNW